MKLSTALTADQRTALECLHRQSDNHRERQRAHAILLQDKGFTFEQVADILQNDTDTIRRWNHRWTQGGIHALRDAPRSGRPSKLDRALDEALRDILEYPSPDLKALLLAEAEKRG